MSEIDTMRPRVVKALRPLHAVAVENSVGPGTPDINYADGWIELKWLRRWPARQDTVVRIDHYTPQQRVFAVKRRRVDGDCWMLLQVREQWLLFDGAVAAMVFNKATAKELFDAAELVFTNGLKDEELVKCVSQGLSTFTFNAAEWV